MITRRLALLGPSATLACGASEVPRLRVAAQRTGTFAWELDVMKDRGFDRAAALGIEQQAFATEEASKVALLAGAVDVIVSDLVWTADQRALGADFMFFPFSTMIGALITPSNSPLQRLADLRGKRLGVVGGALDKNFILLRIFAARNGLDVRREIELAYGAPPLLSQKLMQGELDALLTYWNFAAALRVKNFRPLLEMADVETALGASAPVAFLGYVFRAAFARQSTDALDRFLVACRRARKVLAAEPDSWNALNVRLRLTDDPDLLALYRKLYLNGAPPGGAGARADARLMLDLLAREGALRIQADEGLFYSPAGE